MTSRQWGYLCGCWYILPGSHHSSATSRKYLPQVDVNVHSTVLSTTSRTILTQTFVNPSDDKLEKVNYTFPLYDGSCVVGFKCTVDGEVIRGVVKDREEAKADYEEAVKKGKHAGLLQQSSLASDTFTTSIGNIPAQTKAVIEITYLGELQHDAQTDGVRFTIPTIISPRYASASLSVWDIGENLPTSLGQSVDNGAFRITVDVAVDHRSRIEGLQSPSHPIAVSLGRTSVSERTVFEHYLASAAVMWNRSAGIYMETDFVLIVNAKDQEVPCAFLETHPSIPHQRAIMTTLVPKFNIPNISPEIIFIIDRSGSMVDKVATLQSALKVFLKSLPVGVKFNICSFGDRYCFLWVKSQTYNESNLKDAMRYVDTVKADMGGTVMLEPIEATVNNRFRDLETEILLLTDGEIWNQQQLFKYINTACSENRIRIFSLGIGHSASHSLVQGIARAGGGFAQTVLNGEELDTKVVRMLKGALTPHVKDYTIEIQYEGDSPDDFEIIEKSNEIPEITNSPPPPYKKISRRQSLKKAIPLFDPFFKETNTKSTTSTNQENFVMPPPPKILQAPFKITSLFPFSRTSVYLLLSPDTAQKPIKSVMLKGTSAHGPLVLEIPVQVIGPGETIHQLAARKITQELEEDRGWIFEAKDCEGNVIVRQHESKQDDIVRREAVRIGLLFQVSSRWCSFVAIGKDQSLGYDEFSSRSTERPRVGHSMAMLNTYDPTIEDSDFDGAFVYGEYCSSTTTSRSLAPYTQYGYHDGLATMTQKVRVTRTKSRGLRLPILPGVVSAVSTLMKKRVKDKPPSVPQQSIPQQSIPQQSIPQQSVPQQSIPQEHVNVAADQSKSVASPSNQGTQKGVHKLISLQSFDGSWNWTQSLFGVMDLQPEEVEQKLEWSAIFGNKCGDGERDEQKKQIVATLAVVSYLHIKCLDTQEMWNLVMDKAVDWAATKLENLGCPTGKRQEEWVKAFSGIIV